MCLNLLQMSKFKPGTGEKTLLTISPLASIKATSLRCRRNILQLSHGGTYQEIVVIYFSSVCKHAHLSYFYSKVSLHVTSGGHVEGVTSKRRPSAKRKVNRFLFFKCSYTLKIAI